MGFKQLRSKWIALASSGDKCVAMDVKRQKHQTISGLEQGGFVNFSFKTQ